MEQQYFARYVIAIQGEIVFIKNQIDSVVQKIINWNEKFTRGSQYQILTGRRKN